MSFGAEMPAHVGRKGKREVKQVERSAVSRAKQSAFILRLQALRSIRADDPSFRSLSGEQLSNVNRASHSRHARPDPIDLMP